MTIVSKDEFNLLVEKLTDGSWRLTDYKSKIMGIINNYEYTNCKHHTVEYWNNKYKFNVCELADVFVQQKLKDRHTNNI